MNERRRIKKYISAHDQLGSRGRLIDALRTRKNELIEETNALRRQLEETRGWAEHWRASADECFISAVNALPKSDMIKLANDLGVSRTTVSRWRSGKSLPHPIMRKPVYDAIVRQAHDLDLRSTWDQ